MANRFLEFYNEELTALRGRAARFAQAYPKIAGRLRLSRDTSDDPHVERLIQAFAFSTARIRQKLDDSFPELSDSLLETLYPHYLAPLPAMSVVALEPVPGLDGAQIVPRGTEISSEAVGDDVCRFRTTQDVTLAPIEIVSTEAMVRPLDAPAFPGQSPAGCLRITIRPRGKTVLSDLKTDRLRFYIQASAPQAAGLFELIHNACMGVAVAEHSNDASPHIMPATCVKPVGFARNEAMLPYPRSAFPSYRILTEFFALPQKFRFFDVEIGTPRGSDRVDLYFYFNRSPTKAEIAAVPTALILFATPVINLFDARAEPILLDATRTEYPIRANARRPKTQMIHSIKEVSLTHNSGQKLKARPFFESQSSPDADTLHWQLHRPSDQGTRTYTTRLAFVDHIRRPKGHDNIVAGADVRAFNGDLPSKLPFGGGAPRLFATTQSDLVGSVKCLEPMTPTQWQSDNDERSWRLLSHLTLNHLSVSQGGADVLRGILKLYNMQSSQEIDQMIDSVSEVVGTQGVARVGDSMVSGLDIHITFDPDLIVPAEAYVFATVLDRFLGAYTTLNTYTRLSAQMSGAPDLLARWSARAGEGVFL